LPDIDKVTVPKQQRVVEDAAGILLTMFNYVAGVLRFHGDADSASRSSSSSGSDGQRLFCVDCVPKWGPASLWIVILWDWLEMGG